jgi:hypothetical protein
MKFKLTVDKMENITPEDVEISDIFYCRGLKKSNAMATLGKAGRKYTASMDILENSLITRYRQRCQNERS